MFSSIFGGRSLNFYFMKTANIPVYGNIAVYIYIKGCLSKKRLYTRIRFLSLFSISKDTTRPYTSKLWSHWQLLHKTNELRFCSIDLVNIYLASMSSGYILSSTNQWTSLHIFDFFYYFPFVHIFYTFKVQFYFSL